MDEKVGLHKGQGEIFFAELGDRFFRFTLNLLGQEWAASKITGAELRKIGEIAEDEDLVLERSGTPDDVVNDDDTIDLTQVGVERIRSGKRDVTVFYDDEPTKLPSGVYTTEQLYKKFAVEHGYVLNILDGEQLRPLKPHERVRIKDGMRFYSQVPCGASS